MTFMKYFFVFGDKYFAEIMPKNFYHENELYFRSVLWQRRSPRFICCEIFFSVSSHSFSCFHAFYFAVLHIFICMYYSRWVAGLFCSWLLFHCYFWPLFRFCMNFIVHFSLCLIWIYLHSILFAFLFISFEYVFTFWFAWFSNCELHFERSLFQFSFLTSEALPVLGKEICLFLRGKKKLKKKSQNRSSRWARPKSRKIQKNPPKSHQFFSIFVPT